MLIFENIEIIAFYYWRRGLDNDFFYNFSQLGWGYGGRGHSSIQQPIIMTLVNMIYIFSLQRNFNVVFGLT